MQLILDIPTNENWSEEDAPRFREIFTALIQSGALSGVKGGQAIIHFDAEGVFRGIQLDYWPYRRRTKT